MEELCDLLKIEKTHSTAYHRETVGTIERNHRNLNEYLRAFLKESKLDWEELLKYFCYCHKATPHTVFNFNYSPFELVFAKKPNNFVSIFQNNVEPIYNIENFAKEAKFCLQVALKHARELLRKAKLNANKFYDRKINPLQINIGDKVAINNFAGNKVLDPLYNSPFTVLDIKDFNLILRNDDNKKITKIHKNNVKIY